MAFPTQNQSFGTIFLSAPDASPLKSANFLLVVVSPSLNTPTRPTSENTFWGWGAYKKEGAYKKPAAGGLRNIQTPLNWLLGRNRRSGGGVYNFSLDFIDGRAPRYRTEGVRVIEGRRANQCALSRDTFGLVELIASSNCQIAMLVMCRGRALSNLLSRSLPERLLNPQNQR